MNRVRRRHHGSSFTRPPTRTRVPYDRLIDLAEGLQMFVAGFESADRRTEQDIEDAYGRGYRAGVDDYEQAVGGEDA